MAGLTAEAIAQNEATLKLCEAKLGADQFETLAARNNLGLAYRDAGRLAEALDLFEGALARLEVRPGDGHPLTLECRENLAAAYEPLGRYREAEELERGTLARRRKGVKAGNPVLAIDLSALGAICCINRGGPTPSRSYGSVWRSSRWPHPMTGLAPTH